MSSFDPIRKAFDTFKLEAKSWSEPPSAWEAFVSGWKASLDYYESHEVLGDIVSLESERQALNGGGPGWRDRWDKAMQRACEIFEE